MYHACALRGFPTAAEGPCLYLHLACRDEGLQGKQMVDGLYHTIASTFFKAHVIEKHLFLLVCIKFGYVGLGLGADDYHFGVLSLNGLAYCLGKPVSG